MAITDFNLSKKIDVVSVSGTPTISRALCFKITSGDDSTTGTGEIVLDWSNISSQADIGVYDENDTLLDYYFESFDATAETAVIWVYRDWVRDGSTQAQITYGNGPSDQSVAASTVFDKENNLFAGYLFNESSGDLLDVTSNNYDGTVHGPTREIDGVIGRGYSFDGTDDYIAMPQYYDYTGVGSFTIFAWVKVPIDGGGWSIYDFDRNEYFNCVAGNDPDSIANEGDVVGFHTGGTGSTDDFLGNTNIRDNSPHLLVCRYDSATGDKDIFVDASLDAEQTMADSLGSGNTRYGIIGDGSECDVFDGNRNDFYYTGDLNDLRHYTAFISAEEITAYYDATKSSPDFFSQQGAEETGKVLLQFFMFPF